MVGRSPVAESLDLTERDDRLVVAWLVSLIVGGGLSQGLTIAQALRLWVEDGASVVSVDEDGEAWMRVGRVEWARGLSLDDVLPELPGKARRGRG